MHKGVFGYLVNYIKGCGVRNYTASLYIIEDTNSSIKERKVNSNEK